MENKNELLLVVSKIKNELKKEDMSVSMEAITHLSDELLTKLKKAAIVARGKKRKVIKKRDLEQE